MIQIKKNIFLKDGFTYQQKRFNTFLKGLIDTDGCNGEKELTFDTTSRKLCECFRFILLRMGIPSSGYTRDRIEKVKTKRNYYE